MQHFRPHAVHYRKCNVRPVLRWIYMNAERTFAKRRVHDFNDCVRHRARIRVGRYNGGKGFLYFLSIAFVWTCFILGCALLVGGRGGMREVIGAAGECAGNDDRGFDAPQRQFAGILYRHRIHARLRGKVGREIRGRSTRRTAAGHPDEQPLALFSHLGQRYAVYPLGAEHVDVVEFSQLLRRECFRRSKDHVPGIVHEDIEPALFGDNLADRRFDGFLRRHVQFNGAHVNLIVVRKLFHVRNLRCVAAGGIPHRGVDSVAGLREGIGGQTAKAARSSSDYDYLLHD